MTKQPLSKDQLKRLDKLKPDGGVDLGCDFVQKTLQLPELDLHPDREEVIAHAQSCERCRKFLPDSK